jgi:hypothetical protein
MASQRDIPIPHFDIVYKEDYQLPHTAFFVSGKHSDRIAKFSVGLYDR